MKFTTETHVDGYEVFNCVRAQFGKNIEGAFNEQFTPSQNCSVAIYMVPPEEYEDYNEEEVLISQVIVKEVPELLGKFIYIDIDY